MTIKILFLPESTEGVAEGAVLANESDLSRPQHKQSKDPKDRK